MSRGSPKGETDFAGERKPRGPNGGRRPGAGRPPGSRNALPAGTARAIKALRHRVPEGVAPQLADVADEAFAAVVAVMRKPATPGAFARLQAAAAIREEVCGPVPKKHEVTGKDGEAIKHEVRIAINTGGK
jgi:hypothetical protein